MKKSFILLLALLVSVLAMAQTQQAKKKYGKPGGMPNWNNYTLPLETYPGTILIWGFGSSLYTSDPYYYYEDYQTKHKYNLNYYGKGYNAKAKDTVGNIPNAMLQYRTKAEVTTAGHPIYESIKDMIEKTTLIENAKSNRFKDACYYGYIMQKCIDSIVIDTIKNGITIWSKAVGDTMYANLPMLYILHYTDSIPYASTYKYMGNINGLEYKNGEFTSSTWGGFWIKGLQNVSFEQSDFDFTNKCTNHIEALKPTFQQIIYNSDGTPKTVTINTSKIETVTQEVVANYDIVLGEYSIDSLEIIYNALSHFRTEYTNLNDTNFTAKNSFTQDEARLLDSLKRIELLYLNYGPNDSHNQFVPFGVKVTVTIFPIVRTAYDPKTSQSIALTTKYAQIVLDGTKNSSGWVWGNIDDMPTALQYEPYVKRMYADDEITIPYDIERNDNTSYYPGQCELVETNDPKYSNNLSALALTIDNDDPLLERITYTIDNDSCFNDGYWYTFRTINIPPTPPTPPETPDIPMSPRMGNSTIYSTNCDDAFFTLKIIPKVATYTGTNEDWHDDNNWATTDQSGKITHNEGFVPSERTKVIIPNDNRVVLPGVLPCGETTTSQPPISNVSRSIVVYRDKCSKEEIATWDIEGMHKYEDGFIVNSCGTIYLKAGAELGNQHCLRYNEALTDIEVPAEQWSLIGFALEDMVSGDMFVEPTDNDNPFVIPTQGNRKNVRVWQKVYNRNMEQMTWSGNNDIITSTQWNTSTNTVRHRYQPGTAVLVWPYDNSNGSVTKNGNITFRFPKQDTEYYYFTDNGNTKTSTKEWVVGSNWNTRSDRLVVGNGMSYHYSSPIGEYYADKEITLIATSNSKLFAFSNPLLDWIKIDEFIKYNNSVLEAPYETIIGSEGETTISQISVVGTRSNTVVNQPTNGWLKPSQAIMLHATDSCSTITVKIPVAALKATLQPAAWKTQQTAATNESTLYMTAVCNGQTSYASIYEETTATNDYNSNEDAELLYIDQEITPAAIYTIASNKALTINGLSTFSSVPMVIYTTDSTTRKAKVTFNGVNSFNGDISLLDIATGSTTLISEGDVLTLNTTGKHDNARYYLQKSINTTTDTDLVDNDNNINIFTATDGTIEIIANEELKSVIVYSATGQEIMRNAVNHRFMSCSLPAGVYVIKAYTQHSQIVKKVVVK